VGDVLGLLQHLQSALSRMSGAVLAVPGMLLQNKESALRQRQKELKENTQDLIRNHDSKLLLFETMIRLMDPVHILRKGFAMLKVGEKIITNEDVILPGTEITILRAADEIKAIVSSSEEK
jgi:exodeoxyribonuclease VII large subunit